MNSIQITLYELLGYLFPGMIALLSVWTGLHALFWPRAPLPLWADSSSNKTIIVLLLVAYLLGHMVQGLANVLQRFPLVKPDHNFHLPAELKTCLRAALSTQYRVNADKLTISDIFDFCDEVLLHYKSVGEREIFTYREGFYRALFVSLALLTLAAAILGSASPGASILLSDKTILVPRGFFFSIGILSAVGALIALQRYKRFARYRIPRCLLRFLALVVNPLSIKEPAK